MLQVLGLNSEYQILFHNIKAHCSKKHGLSPGAESDFTVILPPGAAAPAAAAASPVLPSATPSRTNITLMPVKSPEPSTSTSKSAAPKTPIKSLNNASKSATPKSPSSSAKLVQAKSKFKTVAPTAVKDCAAKTPHNRDKSAKAEVGLSVARQDKSGENKSFSTKGYPGPYHCLAAGCHFVLERFDKQTQKLLVHHWLDDHQDISSLLYWDRTTNTVLNSKVLLNNVGHCSLPSCRAVLYSSRKPDFHASVAAHWKREHGDHTAGKSSLSLHWLSVDYETDTSLAEIISDLEPISLAAAASLVSKVKATQDGKKPANIPVKQEEATPANTPSKVPVKTSTKIQSKAKTPGKSPAVTKTPGKSPALPKAPAMSLAKTPVKQDQDQPAASAKKSGRKKGTPVICGPSGAVPAGEAVPAPGSLAGLALAHESETEGALTMFEYAGPYRCGECDHQVPNTPYVNSRVLEHWVKLHPTLPPHKLRSRTATLTGGPPIKEKRNKFKLCLFDVFLTRFQSLSEVWEDSTRMPYPQSSCTVPQFHRPADRRQNECALFLSEHRPVHGLPLRTG